MNPHGYAESVAAIVDAWPKWMAMMERERNNPTPPLELSPKEEARFHAWLKENGES